MLDLRNVLELVVDTLNEGTFAQQEPIHDRHDLRFHISFQGGDELKSALKELFKQSVRDVAFITKLTISR